MKHVTLCPLRVSKSTEISNALSADKTAEKLRKKCQVYNHYIVKLLAHKTCMKGKDS